MKISSRTLHIPWDEAGCLCPVGDLFNYAAPGGESNGFENIESSMHTSSFEVCSLPNGDTFDNVVPDHLEACYQRLTDGGFEEDLAAYCFYAKRNYRKGEQVFQVSLTLLKCGCKTFIFGSLYPLLSKFDLLASKNQKILK